MIKGENMNWDLNCDVLVVGSGNGGLTSALCLHEMGVQNVSIIESSDQAGGTSALSGGGIWIPCNPYAEALGIKDSYEDAYQYVKATDPENTVPDKLVRAFIENGPSMLRFMHEHTRMRYLSLAHYPDYFSNLPGARDGHRSLEPEPFSITNLKNRGTYLRDSHPILKIIGLIPMTQTEAHAFNVQSPGWKRLAFKLFFKYFIDIPQRITGKRARRSTCGSAGVGRLLWSIEEKNIPLHLNTELVDILIEDNKVAGCIVNINGDRKYIKTRKGIICASGGFEQNQRMRLKYLPKPTDSTWTTTHKGNNGSVIEIAHRAGAAISRMQGAWWVPTFKVPGISYAYPSIMEKSYPGSIVVHKKGKRVANESMNYQMYVRECQKLHDNGIDTSNLWLIFDSNFRKKYIVSPILTSKLFPDWIIPKSYFCNSFLTKASSIKELSEKTGIDCEGLKETIGRFNEYAITGKDLDFGRGDTEYDRYYADPSVKPNPCLSKISKAPYYAIKIYLGEFGTNGGLDIDENACVKNTNGEIIEGLYAVGNCAAAILPAYPGPGSTLGPAMTFAFLAAKHISQ